MDPQETPDQMEKRVNVEWQAQPAQQADQVVMVPPVNLEMPAKSKLFQEFLDQKDLWDRKDQKERKGKPEKTEAPNRVPKEIPETTAIKDPRENLEPKEKRAHLAHQERRVVATIALLLVCHLDFRIESSFK